MTGFLSSANQITPLTRDAHNDFITEDEGLRVAIKRMARDAIVLDGLCKLTPDVRSGAFQVFVVASDNHHGLDHGDGDLTNAGHLNWDEDIGPLSDL